MFGVFGGRFFGFGGGIRSKKKGGVFWFLNLGHSSRRRIFFSTMLAGYPAGAAELANSSTLEEIVVTAQKRAGSVQDTPFSVSATSQQQIR